LVFLARTLLGLTLLVREPLLFIPLFGLRSLSRLTLSLSFLGGPLLLLLLGEALFLDTFRLGRLFLGEGLLLLALLDQALLVLLLLPGLRLPLSLLLLLLLALGQLFWRGLRRPVGLNLRLGFLRLGRHSRRRRRRLG